MLQKRKERFASVRNILLNKGLTGFIFILNPERLPILETAKALKLLQKHQLEVNTLFINKMLPSNMEETFWKKEKRMRKNMSHGLKKSFKSSRKFTFHCLIQILTMLLYWKNSRNIYIDRFRTFGMTKERLCRMF
ncbi:ArsA-related P-loop ATPase [Priestia abyssalis]